MTSKNIHRPGILIRIESFHCVLLVVELPATGFYFTILKGNEAGGPVYTTEPLLTSVRYKNVILPALQGVQLLNIIDDLLEEAWRLDSITLKNIYYELNTRYLKGLQYVLDNDRGSSLLRESVYTSSGNINRRRITIEQKKEQSDKKGADRLRGEKFDKYWTAIDNVFNAGCASNT